MTGQAAAKRAEEVVARLWRDRIGYVDAINLIRSEIDAAVAEAIEEVHRGGEKVYEQRASDYVKATLDAQAKEIERQVAEARREERVEIAHRIRLIFKDAATFYEVKEALEFADELDPALTPPPPAPREIVGTMLGQPITEAERQRISKDGP